MVLSLAITHADSKCAPLNSVNNIHTNVPKQTRAKENTIWIIHLLTYSELTTVTH